MWRKASGLIIPGSLCALGWYSVEQNGLSFARTEKLAEVKAEGTLKRYGTMPVSTNSSTLAGKALKKIRAQPFKAAHVMKHPDFSGEYVLDLERSQHDEMTAIMGKIGVPSYILRMGRLSASRMTVEQSQDNTLIKEEITQLGGLYKNTVELYMDEREFIGKNPFTGSEIKTRTKWEKIPVENLHPCNVVDEKHVVCCVSRATYSDSGHTQVIIRFMDDAGKTFHSVNTLYPADGGSPITSHRFLNKTSST